MNRALCTRVQKKIVAEWLRSRTSDSRYRAISIDFQIFGRPNQFHQITDLSAGPGYVKVIEACHIKK